MILRQDCLETDLALLTPYLNGDDADYKVADVDADVEDEAAASDTSRWVGGWVSGRKA